MQPIINTKNNNIITLSNDYSTNNIINQNKHNLQHNETQNIINYDNFINIKNETDIKNKSDIKIIQEYIILIQQLKQQNLYLQRQNEDLNYNNSILKTKICNLQNELDNNIKYQKMTDYYNNLFIKNITQIKQNQIELSNPIELSSTIKLSNPIELLLNKPKKSILKK